MNQQTASEDVQQMKRLKQLREMQTCQMIRVFFLFTHKTVQEGFQGLDIIKGCTHAPDSLGILEDQLFQNIYPASYLHKGYGFETVSYLAMVGRTLAMESISLAEVIRLPPPSRFSLQPTPDTNCGFNFRKRDNAKRYR